MRGGEGGKIRLYTSTKQASQPPTTHAEKDEKEENNNSMRKAAEKPKKHNNNQEFGRVVFRSINSPAQLSLRASIACYCSCGPDQSLPQLAFAPSYP